MRRALLVAAVVLWGLVPACAGRKDGAAIVQRSLLGTLPKESVALLVLETRAIGRAGARADWLREFARIAEEGPFREIRDRLGMELLAGTERIGMAVVPRPDHQVAYAIVAEGKYDRDKVRAVIGGGEIGLLVEAGADLPDLSLLLLDGGLAVGPGEVLETIRSNAAERGRGLDDNAPLLESLRRLPAVAQIWGAIDVRSLSSSVRGFAGSRGAEMRGMPGAAQIESLRSLAFEGRVGERLEFRLLGEAEGEDRAKGLADALRGVLAMARMGAGKEAEKDWLDLLDGMAVEQGGVLVELRGAVPGPLLKSLAAKAGELSPPVGGPPPPVPAQPPPVGAPPLPPGGAGTPPSGS
jgi:hypothetical protein